MEDLKRPRFVENQGNEQNPPDNCTQEIVTSVWSRIFHFGKKNVSNWYPNIAFPQRNRPGSSSPKNAQGRSANLYAHVPLIGARPHMRRIIGNAIWDLKIIIYSHGTGEI